MGNFWSTNQEEHHPAENQPPVEQEQDQQPIEQDQPPTDEQIQNAMEQLILSGHSKASTNNKDFKDACQELLNFNFSTEKRRIFVIHLLTELNGNYVVKIICKGLSSLSKVYTDSKRFEDEACHFVFLCYSFYWNQVSGALLPSPALLVDCTAELCDELTKPSVDKPVNIFLFNSIAKLMEICEVILRARAHLLANNLVANEQQDPVHTFKTLFDILKLRINEEFFEDVLKETLVIARRDKELDFMKFREKFGFTSANLLSSWKELLQLKFVTNWFAVQTAKQDILIHGQPVARRSSNMFSYLYSLVHVVCMTQLAYPDCNLKSNMNDETRLNVIFSHPEILLLSTESCFRLLKPSIPTKYIDDVFHLLETKSNKIVAKMLTADIEMKHFDDQLNVLQREMEMGIFNVDKWLIDNLMMFQSLQSKEYINMRKALTFSLEAIIKSLQLLPCHQPVIDILTFWKKSFIDEKYFFLAQIAELMLIVINLDHQEVPRNMEKLATFLRQLSPHLRRTMNFWHQLFAIITIAFPNTWDSKANFLNALLAPKFSFVENALFNEIKTKSMTEFVGLLSRRSFTEATKNELLQVACELYNSISKPHEYEFILNGLLLLLPGMNIESARNFLLDFLSKTPNEIINEVIMFSRQLMLQLPVESNTGKRFLEFVLSDELRPFTPLIFQCASILNDNNNKFVNNLVAFLLVVFDKTLTSQPKRSLFAGIFQKYFAMVTSLNSEVCIPLMACIAGSIAVDTFDENANDMAVNLTCYYLDIHKTDELPVQPVHALGLYMRLFQAFKKVSHMVGVDNRHTLNSFCLGINTILKLPLQLSRIHILVCRIVKILISGNFKRPEQVMAIMLHLFGAHGDIVLVNPTGLWKHFSDVLTLSIAKTLSQMHIDSKLSTGIRQDVIETKVDDKATLFQILVNKTPQSFAERTSSDLMRYVIERLERNNALHLSTCLLPLANMFIEDNASVKHFKRDFKDIEKMLRPYLSKDALFPLISDCITECHHLHITDERTINHLVTVISEKDWSQDLHQVYTYMSSYLNIPKQLVLAFQAAPETEKNYAIQRVFKVLEMLCQSDQKFLYGAFDTAQDINVKLQSLAQHDFKMLMNDTSLQPNEMCIILQEYSNSLLLRHLPISTDVESCDGDCWSTDYNSSDPLTPGKFGFLIYQHLKRLTNDNDSLLREKAEISNMILRRPLLYQRTRDDFKEYMELLVKVMKISNSLNEIKHLILTVPYNLAVGCEEIILGAFVWKSERKDAAQSSQIVKTVLGTINCFSVSQYGVPTSFCQAISKILNSIEHEEVIDNLIQLLLKTFPHPSSAPCIDAVVGWSKEESLALVKKFQDQYEGLESTRIQALSKKLEIWLQLLPFVSKVFPDSAKKVGDFFDAMVDNLELDDPQSLTRIPIWFKEMTDSANISRDIIESWCISLMFYKHLTSRDIDAIVNLTPSTICLLTNDSGEIEECLFKETAPKTWQDGDIDPDTLTKNVASFKRCLQFAKILQEFTSIALRVKDQEEVLTSVRDGTHDLCESFKHNNSPGGMFKVRYNVMKELFCVLFSGEDSIITSEHLPPHSKATSSLITLFRRLARSIHSRPVLIGHVKSLIHQTLQEYKHFKDSYQFENDIHKHILELEPNQDTIHSLQASGYNQGEANEDLWYSASIQYSSYIYAAESIQKFRVERQLKQILREWRHILEGLQITEVNVHGQMMKTNELMRYTDSLDTIESQLEAIKNATQNAPLNEWGAVRRRQLIRKEKYIRMTIEEDAKKENKDSKLSKLEIVWDNQLLDCVNTCTESIPGCYAPNGFHSEKPVICGLAVDNRILTLYKQEKANTRTELEDVEVKLYPVGMLVYGVYSKTHSYDTDQLWAAFFKMLLLKRLVPRILLTNASPGFEWIKRFVEPEVSRPDDINFFSCNSLIPFKEDSFDYEPNEAFHQLGKGQHDNQVDELIILTLTNVEQVNFTTLKSPKRDQLIQEVMQRVPQVVKERLSERHHKPKVRDQLVNRLQFAIRKATEDSIDTVIPDNETVSRYIKIKKLSQNCEDEANVLENGADFYSGIIVDALHSHMDGNMEYYTGYNCCDSVVFLQ